MRKKPAAGYVLNSFVAAAPIRRMNRNPWPPNSRHFNGTASALCASGLWVSYSQFTLEDGTNWVFPFAYSATELLANSLLYGWPGFNRFDPEFNYLGTWTVGSIFWEPLDQFLDSNLTVWLAAH
jgi:hypothetical protein